MAARLLLVHSPLVGPATWDRVAASLAGHGHEVSLVTARGIGRSFPGVILMRVIMQILRD